MSLTAIVGAALGSRLMPEPRVAIASETTYEALVGEVMASTKDDPRHEAVAELLSRSRVLGVVPLKAMPVLIAGDDFTRRHLAAYLAAIVPELGDDWRRLLHLALNADEASILGLACGLSPSVSIELSSIEKAGRLPQSRAENAVDAIATGVYPTLEFVRGVADLVRAEPGPLKKLGAAASIRLGVDLALALRVLLEDRADRTGSRDIDLVLLDALDACPVDWGPVMQAVVVDPRSSMSLGRVLLSRPSLCGRVRSLVYHGLSSQSFEVRCDYACATARCGVPAMVSDSVSHLVPLLEQALDREDEKVVGRLVRSMACTGTLGRAAVPDLLRRMDKFHGSTIDDVAEAITACADPSDEPEIVEAGQRLSDDRARRALDRAAKRVRDGLRPKLTGCGPR